MLFFKRECEIEAFGFSFVLLMVETGSCDHVFKLVKLRLKRQKRRQTIENGQGPKSTEGVGNKGTGGGVSLSVSEKQVKIGDLSGEGEVGRDR